MTTADVQLAEDGSVHISAGLPAAWTRAAVATGLRALQERDGLAPSPFARGLLAVLDRAASQPVSPTKPTGDTPATVMLGTEKVAALLGCSPQYVRRLAARGELPGAQRVGRIWLVPSTSLDAVHHEGEECPDGEAAAEDGDHGRGTNEQNTDTAA